VKARGTGGSASPSASAELVVVAVPGLRPRIAESSDKISNARGLAQSCESFETCCTSPGRATVRRQIIVVSVRATVKFFGAGGHPISLHSSYSSFVYISPSTFRGLYLFANNFSASYTSTSPSFSGLEQTAKFHSLQCTFMQTVLLNLCPQYFLRYGLNEDYEWRTLYSCNRIAIV
jgi:hypothetical protein